MQKNRTSLLLWIFWGFMLILSFVMIRWIVPNASSKVTKHATDPEIAEILDVKPFGFTKAEAFQALDAMGEEGRRHYLSFHKREDMYFPLVYGLFLSLTVYLLIRNSFRNNLKYLILAVPILAILGDLTENHHVMMLVNEFPNLNFRTVTIASTANTIKWGTLILTLLIIVGLVVLRIAPVFLRSGRRNQD